MEFWIPKGQRPGKYGIKTSVQQNKTDKLKEHLHKETLRKQSK